MVELVISLLITLTTVTSDGAKTSKLGETSKTKTSTTTTIPPALTTHGGSGTWANGTE